MSYSRIDLDHQLHHYHEVDRLHHKIHRKMMTIKDHFRMYPTSYRQIPISIDRYDE